MSTVRRGFLLLLLFLPAVPAQGQEPEAPAKGGPLIRNAPSEVVPSRSALLAAGAIFMSLLLAALLMQYLRTRKRTTKPARARTDDLPMVIPIVVPLAEPMAPSRKGRRMVPAEEAFEFEEADELPSLLKPASGRSQRLTVKSSIDAMETLARALRAVKQKNGVARRLLRRLRSGFVAADADGALWTVGLHTGAWYRADDGGWSARLPPAFVYLEEDFYLKVIDLQTAFS